MYSRKLPDFSVVARPATPDEPLPVLTYQQRKGRWTSKASQDNLPEEAIMAEQESSFPWTRLEEDFFYRLRTKIAALTQVRGEELLWRDDIHQNFTLYRPLPRPGTPVGHMYLKDAAGTLHKFSSLDLRFAHFRRRFPHDVRLIAGDHKYGRERDKDFSLDNLIQSHYPLIEHRVAQDLRYCQKTMKGVPREKLLNPLAWSYKEGSRPCYVNLLRYGEPVSEVQICSHNFWKYKGDDDCELEWQKLDAEIRSDIMRTNLKPGMFMRVLSRDLGAISVKGYFNRSVLPAAYGEKELRGPEDFTYDAGWLKVRGGRPKRLPHRDGRRLPRRKHEDLPDRPAHIPSASDFTPVTRSKDDPDFADQLWRTLEDGSFYPPGYQPNPAYAPRFYAVDPLKLGVHPWQAEEIRLRELEFAKEL